eukprot:gnl/Dysnectes_brevis/5117_a7221_441.p1 GENE.gnl/Dysnectes_brevis/5117_a7221_441~~gnl/Dysnectes_brevis/5117_a7221_441.p1  ORF type:complete len:1085 (+),score=127.17 gnl/Dysnectes_brevis/5117_a7221_441:39-3293(+)
MNQHTEPVHPDLDPELSDLDHSGDIIDDMELRDDELSQLSLTPINDGGSIDESIEQEQDYVHSLVNVNASLSPQSLRAASSRAIADEVDPDTLSKDELSRRLRVQSMENSLLTSALRSKIRHAALQRSSIVRLKQELESSRTAATQLQESLYLSQEAALVERGRRDCEVRASDLRLRSLEQQLRKAQNAVSRTAQAHEQAMRGGVNATLVARTLQLQREVTELKLRLMGVKTELNAALTDAGDQRRLLQQFKDTSKRMSMKKRRSAHLAPLDVLSRDTTVHQRHNVVDKHESAEVMSHDESSSHTMTPSPSRSGRSGFARTPPPVRKDPSSHERTASRGSHAESPRGRVVNQQHTDVVKHPRSAKNTTTPVASAQKKPVTTATATVPSKNTKPIIPKKAPSEKRRSASPFRAIYRAFSRGRKRQVEPLVDLSAGNPNAERQIRVEVSQIDVTETAYLRGSVSGGQTRSKLFVTACTNTVTSPIALDIILPFLSSSDNRDLLRAASLVESCFELVSNRASYPPNSVSRALEVISRFPESASRLDLVCKAIIANWTSQTEESEEGLLFALVRLKSNRSIATDLISNLSGLISKPSLSISSKLAAVKLMSVLSVGGKARIQIRNSGGISALIQNLQRDSSLTRVILGCLVNLSVNGRNKHAIREAGGLALLVEVLKTESDVADSISFSLRTLANLALSPQNRKLLLDLGAGEKATHCLRSVSPGSDSPLGRYLARFLAALYSDVLPASGAMEVTTSILEDALSSPPSQNGLVTLTESAFALSALIARARGFPTSSPAPLSASLRTCRAAAAKACMNGEVLGASCLRAPAFSPSLSSFATLPLFAPSPGVSVTPKGQWEMLALRAASVADTLAATHPFSWPTPTLPPKASGERGPGPSFTLCAAPDGFGKVSLPANALFWSLISLLNQLSMVSSLRRRLSSILLLPLLRLLPLALSGAVEEIMARGEGPALVGLTDILELLERLAAPIDGYASPLTSMLCALISSGESLSVSDRDPRHRSLAIYGDLMFEAGIGVALRMVAEAHPPSRSDSIVTAVYGIAWSRPVARRECPPSLRRAALSLAGWAIRD